MGPFIAKQPNGKYCRFSTVVDTVTHYNFTAEDYVNNVTGTVESLSEANYILKTCTYDISDVIIKFRPTNMSSEKFIEILKSICE